MNSKEKSLSLKTLPVRIIIPVALTILLFVLTIFLLIIPLVEKNMLDDKRESIMALTESAWSILNLYHSKSQNKEISDTDARKLAIEHVKHLRYGPKQKDYFWINDMVPNMVMHPYQPDLEGKDISTLEDPKGKRLFAEMVRIVQHQDAGFVDYLWQWKDDSKRIVPKISYVKGFKPWSWIVGTGIYVEDVRAQIRTITLQLTYTCLLIMAIFLTLSGYIIWQSTQTKKAQIRAMEQSRLREKQLLQADKMSSLGILVAGVAHEINNPATSLMLNAPNLKKAWHAFTPVLDDHFKDHPEKEVCAMPYAELSNRIESMLTAIEDSSARIKRIISDLKDFSKPSGTDMGDRIDVNQLVNKSVDLMRSLLKKSTSHLFVEYADALPKIQGNFQKLQQVVINLLVNAGQALENPDQSISVITVNDETAGFVVIEVTDTGRGMTSEDLKKMKEPFFTTRRDDGGTGLGLSISAKIISDHKGFLEFSSTAKKGLTAKILLPYEESE
ncbi:MAG: two component system sensor protein [Desulfobacteraceae bacterium]|nr:two component system sensor protein [Desulfobacteraceae bacterium]